MVVIFGDMSLAQIVQIVQIVCTSKMGFREKVGYTLEINRGINHVF